MIHIPSKLCYHGPFKNSELDIDNHLQVSEFFFLKISLAISGIVCLSKFDDVFVAILISEGLDGGTKSR